MSRIKNWIEKNPEIFEELNDSDEWELRELKEKEQLISIETDDDVDFFDKILKKHLEEKNGDAELYNQYLP